MNKPERGLLWSVTDYSHEVDYDRFCLIDDDETVESPDLGAEGPTGTETVTVGLGWLALRSDGSGHIPTITMQGWEREPPVEQRQWRVREELEVEFVSTSVRIWGVAAGPSQGPVFALPWSDDRKYRVRMFRDGGTDSKSVAQQVVDLVDDDEAEDGIWGLEEWLFQFWPANS